MLTKLQTTHTMQTQSSTDSFDELHVENLVTSRDSPVRSVAVARNWDVW